MFLYQLRLVHLWRVALREGVTTGAEHKHTPVEARPLHHCCNRPTTQGNREAQLNQRKQNRTTPHIADTLSYYHIQRSALLTLSPTILPNALR
jgi:hypothetical protein